MKLLGRDFGKRPIAEITPQELLHELRKHERRGRLDTANLLRAFASRVFCYSHKREYEVPELPPSLYRTLSEFIIARAIRNLRGHSCRNDSV